MDNIDNQTTMEFWRQAFSIYPILSDGQDLSCRQSMQCAGGGVPVSATVFEVFTLKHKNC